MNRVIIATLLPWAVAFGQDGKPNLIGTWSYHEDSLAADREVDRIEVTGPEVKITERIGRTDLLFTLKYRTDGQAPGQGRWSSNIERIGRWDGQTLVLDTRYKSQSTGATTKHEEFWLSTDGKTLTKKVHWEGPQAKANQLIVFTRIPRG